MSGINDLLMFNCVNLGKKERIIRVREHRKGEKEERKTKK
jgi:hypothetical protein